MLDINTITLGKAFGLLITAGGGAWIVRKALALVANQLVLQVEKKHMADREADQIARDELRKEFSEYCGRQALEIGRIQEAHREASRKLDDDLAALRKALAECQKECSALRRG